MRRQIIANFSLPEAFYQTGNGLNFGPNSRMLFIQNIMTKLESFFAPDHLMSIKKTAAFIALTTCEQFDELVKNALDANATNMQIYFYQENEKIIFQVINNGNTIPLDKVKKIKWEEAALSDKKNDVSKLGGRGIGLRQLVYFIEIAGNGSVALKQNFNDQQKPCGTMVEITCTTEKSKYEQFSEINFQSAIIALRHADEKEDEIATIFSQHADIPPLVEMQFSLPPSRRSKLAQNDPSSPTSDGINSLSSAGIFGSPVSTNERLEERSYGPTPM